MKEYPSVSFFTSPVDTKYNLPLKKTTELSTCLSGSFVKNRPSST